MDFAIESSAARKKRPGRKLSFPVDVKLGNQSTVHKNRTCLSNESNEIEVIRCNMAQIYLLITRLTCMLSHN